MKKVLFALVAVVALLTSCGQSAVQFNDSIVAAHTQTTQIVSDFGSKFNTATSSVENLAKIKTEADSTIAKLDKVLATVSALEAPKGGEDMKASTENIIKEAQEAVKITLKLANFNESTSVDEVNAVISEFTDKYNAISDLDTKLREAQAAFAKEHGMELR